MTRIGWFNSQKSPGWFHRLLVLVMLAGALAMPEGKPAVAQSSEIGWSEPELVFQTEGMAPVGSMALVADARGHLHWFFAHSPEEGIPAGIDYLHWNGEFWSGPNNIILNPDGSGAANIRAAIDAEQNIHLLWGGGNSLYYSSASAEIAVSPRAWSTPHSLVTAIGEPDMILAPNGVIYVVYVDLSLASLGILSSPDLGVSWSQPFSVASSNSGSSPSGVRLAVDGKERLHVVWTEVLLPDGWPPTGVFYAQSLDGGFSWSQPLQIASHSHGQIGVATVGNDQVHLVWRSTIGGDGTFHQWSADGGSSWTDADQYMDGGGLSGLPSFAVDSAGGLHYVIGPAVATSWQTGMLGAYMNVAGADLRTRANQAARWTSPELAVIAITSGNRLHVIFETGFSALWYATMSLAVPELQPPTFVPTAAFEPIETATPSILELDRLPTPVLELGGEQSLPVTSTTMLAPFLGVGVVALLVAVLVFAKTRRHM